MAVRYRDSNHVAGVIEVDFPVRGRAGIDYSFCNWQALRHGGRQRCPQPDACALNENVSMCVCVCERNCDVDSH